MQPCHTRGIHTGQKNLPLHSWSQQFDLSTHQSYRYSFQYRRRRQQSQAHCPQTMLPSTLSGSLGAPQLILPCKTDLNPRSPHQQERHGYSLCFRKRPELAGTASAHSCLPGRQMISPEFCTSASSTAFPSALSGGLRRVPTLILPGEADIVPWVSTLR